MELRHLKYFMRAAELSHFTRAAESLYISQPSLSVHIQQLEEELKTKLFARVGRNVRLTESGEVLFRHAKRAVDELESAGQEIDAMTGLLQGSLSIASVPLFGSEYLPALVDAFSAKHPSLRIKIRVGEADDIESSLVAGNIDLGFSLTPAEHSEIQVAELVTDRSVMVVAATHPLAKKKKLVAGDLESVPVALPSHKLSSSRPIGAYFEALGVTPNIVVEQDDGHALLNLIKCGRCATFLPRYVVKDDPELAFLQLPEPGIVINFGIMWTQLSPAAGQFLEFVKASGLGR